MKRELRNLMDQIARANRLNTRGKREFRSEFRRMYTAQHAAVANAIVGFAGKPLNDETMELMIQALAKTFPPAAPINFVQSVSVDENRMVTVTLTPEAAKLFASRPELQ